MAKKRPAAEQSTGAGDPARGPAAPLVPPLGTPYVVLARKYRPATFDDLIGQEAMVTTLKNAFAADRIAQGYMLTGVRGVGKTTTARILARALNYEREGVDKPTFDMAEYGRHCAEIMEGRHPDVLEMDAASNTGVDNIRELIESARYRPLIARYKVYLIDEVHMLSKGAFNALLKTLEEPPQHVKFIFATTEVRKVPVTVLSRCQRFDLRRVAVPVLVQHFRSIVAKEGGTAEDEEGLALIARAAQGSVRDGLSLLDQALAMGSGAVAAASVRAMLGLADRGRIFDLVERLLAGTAGAALELFAELHRDGAEPLQILGDLAEAVHAATRAKVLGAEAPGEGLSAEERRRAADLAGRLSMPLLARAWQVLLKGLEEAAEAPNAAAAAEMVLIRLAYTADLPPPDAILKALGGDSTARTQSAASAPAASAPAPPAAPAKPLRAAMYAPPPAHAAAARPEPNGLVNGIEAGAADSDIDADGGEDIDDLSDAVPALPTLRTFADVVDLVGAQRDPKLKDHLERNVSLVGFDPAGSIELYLFPAAPRELPTELRQKLNLWTGRPWAVALSNAPGERTIDEVRAEREAAEQSEIENHPAVAAVLRQFPDAKVKVKRLPGKG
jgi:DNA polymerase-3 subunit gamma/tau